MNRGSKPSLIGGTRGDFRSLGSLWFRISLYLAISCETLLLWPALTNAYTVPKVVAVLVGAALTLPALVLCILKREARSRFAKPLLIAFALQTAVLGAATLFSQSPALSFWGGDWRRMGFVTSFSMILLAVAVPFAVRGSIRHWRTLLRLITAVGCIASLYGILQTIGVDPILPSYLRSSLIEQFGGTFRAPGTIGQATYYSNYLLYALFSSIALFYLENSFRSRAFAAFSGFLAFVSIALTVTRGAVLGMAAGLLLLTYSILSRTKFDWRQLRTVSAVLLGGVVLLAPTLYIFSQAPAAKPYRDRVRYAIQDMSGSGRVVLWKDVTLRLLPNFWLQGTGLGMFRPEFAKVRSADYSFAGPDVHWETAHNIFLDRWTEQGLAGLAVFLALAAVTFRNFLRAGQSISESRTRHAVTALVCGFAAALISNNFNGEVIPTTFYFYLWVALSFATMDCFVPEIPLKAAQEPVRPAVRRSLTLAASTCGVAVLSAVLIWHAGRNWVADAYLAQSIADIGAGNATGLYDHGLASAEAFPVTATYQLAFCENVLKFTAAYPASLNEQSTRRLVAEGLAQGLRATHSNDKPMLAWYCIAELGQITADPRAGSWIERLISEDPNWYRGHQLKARYLVKTGQLSGARHHSEIAHDLAPYVNEVTSLLSTLQQIEQEETSGNRSAAVLHQYGKRPLHFEPNVGQAPEGIKFLARTTSYRVAVTTSGFEMALPQRDSDPAVLRMNLVGGNTTAEPRGHGNIVSENNYLIGTDQSKWRTGVGQYSKLLQNDVYRGVDLVYESKDGELEYTFLVDAGVDPERIVLEFPTVDRMEPGDGGDLVLYAAGRAVVQRAPFAYQEFEGTRREVAVRYIAMGKNQIRFGVEEMDRARPLVIDPVLSYSSYLGGSADDTPLAIHVDASGNAYVTGSTASSEFAGFIPTNGFQRGTGDIFVSKLKPDGSDILYTTFIGGAGDESAGAIRVDASGNVYLTGETSSSDFPVVQPAQPDLRGLTDAFVTKLDGDGANIIYSTYLGGTKDDSAGALALDASGNAYVTGSTQSLDFPTVTPFQGFLSGSEDAFVTKLNNGGWGVSFSTYLGGRLADAAQAIGLDASGNVHIAGRTQSRDFPTANAFQSAYGGGFTDGFVSALSASGTSLVRSTYFGGSEPDIVNGLVIDASGNAYLSGTTASPNLPTTAGAYQPARGSGPLDAFSAKLAASGAALLYSTYLDFGNREIGNGIGIDASGNAHVTGSTTATDAMGNVFAVKLNATATAAIYALEFGGNSSDVGTAVGLDGSGNLYVTGYTRSFNFPIWNAVQPTKTGQQDGFISKIQP